VNYVVWVRRIAAIEQQHRWLSCLTSGSSCGNLARSNHKMGYSVEGPGRGMAVGLLGEFDASSLA
jgi:hypothetical protein